MLALAEYRALTCDAGHWLPETTTADADEDWIVPPPVACHACEAMAVAADNHAQRRPKTFHLARYRAERRSHG